MPKLKYRKKNNFVIFIYVDMGKNTQIREEKNIFLCYFLWKTKSISASSYSFNRRDI